MEDFLEKLHIEGFTSRIKRLSDLLLYSTRDLYKTHDMDIEPNWNLIFRLLQENDELTISDMAEKLQLSHPAIVKIINKMKKNGYIITNVDKIDRRKSLLTLSPKAKTDLGHFEELWHTQNRVIENLLADSPHFLNELKNIEQKLIELDYKQRVLNKLNE